MAVWALGINHTTAPLDLRGRFAFAVDQMQPTLHALRQSFSRHPEAAIISTCNRIEIFVTAEKFHGAYRDVRDFISDVTFTLPEEFADHLEVSHDADAVRHLFAVAAGLESVVVGEHEGQVVEVHDAAVSAGVSARGRRARMRVPPPGGLLMCSSPRTAATRSRMPVRP